MLSKIQIFRNSLTVNKYYDKNGYGKLALIFNL